MDCENIEKLIRKYEIGDADYFEKKRVEKHIKGCERCKKKYGAMLLMTALLYSSAKIDKGDLLQKTLAAYALKTLLALLFTGAAAVMVVGYSTMASKHYEAKKAKIKAESYITAPASAAAATTSAGSTAAIPVSGGITTDKGIRIKSESNGKEIIINIDDKNMKIKNRSEK